MEKPLISVILPVYNVEDYIDRCMESVCSQSYSNLEIILIDDGSTDSSSVKCDQYAQKDSRIVVYHKENGGLSDARNYGIERANGEYITCIDSDDYVDKDYVDYLYALLSDDKTMMSICQHRVLFDSGKVKDFGSDGKDVLTNKVCIERMLYHDIIDTSAWAKLYHRTLFSDVKYPYGKLFEDIGTTYKLMLKCDKISVGYQSKYNYIVRSNSIVNCAFNPKKLDLLETTDKMAEDVLNVYPELEKAVLRRRVYARFSTLNQMLNTKDYTNERSQIIDFINKNKKDILSDEKIPKRDVLGIKLLSCGYFVYKICWGLYTKLMK